MTGPEAAELNPLLVALEQDHTTIEQLQARVTAAQAVRDRHVRDALAAGVGGPTVASHSGLSAARVYQIRDGRR